MDVQIVYPDDGWVLHRYALPLVNGIDFVTGSTWKPDLTKQWDITFFINYALYQPVPNSKLIGGMFTHKENDAFDKIAKQCDFCVCMCNMYADYLKQSVNPNTHVIYEAIDMSKFIPKIRLGWAGKIKGDGRKGEDLFEFIKKIPFVELVCSSDTPYGKMPDFYNSIDYVFIPSKIEGGPMSFIEGLACGKEIISTSVGMVRDFKSPYVHVFDRDNLDTLIEILKRIYAERLIRRKVVEHINFDYYIESHVKLFKFLVAKGKS